MYGREKQKFTEKYVLFLILNKLFNYDTIDG